MYWDRFTPSSWEEHRKKVTAESERSKLLEVEAIDIIRLGDRRSEVDHNLRTKVSWPSTYRGEKCRDVCSGGFLVFDAKVLPDKPMALIARYWGGERNRSFRILVEELVIAREILDNESPGRFIERIYPIPEHLTRGQAAVSITFQPQQDRTAGPIFGGRIELLRQEE